MPRYQLSQPVLLLAAVILLAGAIAVGFIRHVSPQPEGTAAVRPDTAHSAKRAPDGAALVRSQVVPKSQETRQSPNSRDSGTGGKSLNAPDEPAPHSSENQSSEAERAVAAFHQSSQCHVASNTIKGLQSEIAACASLGSAMDDICRRNIKQAEAQIQFETARLARCSAVPAVMEKAYFDSVARAAELGNSDAQVCYIQGDFFNTMGRQELEQYKDNARNYIQLGLERGDWRVVSLLAAHSIDNSGRLGDLGLDNPYDVLRMNRLLRHGATGDYGRLLDSEAQDSAVRLSKAQLESAFAWARQEYAQYFRNSPSLTSEPVTCKNFDSNSQSPDR